MIMSGQAIEVDSPKEGLKLVCKTIERKTFDMVEEIKPVNNQRHFLLRTIRGLKYYVMYKREFFHKFGVIFALHGMKGAGESINKENLNLALKYEVDKIMLVYATGYVYVVTPQQWKEFAEQFGTIRETGQGETTYSIPLSYLRRWD